MKGDFLKDTNMALHDTFFQDTNMTLQGKLEDEKKGAMIRLAIIS